MLLQDVLLQKNNTQYVDFTRFHDTMPILKHHVSTGAHHIESYSILQLRTFLTILHGRSRAWQDLVLVCMVVLVSYHAWVVCKSEVQHTSCLAKSALPVFL